VTGFRERELDQCVLTTFGKAAAQTQRQISTLGRFLGPPWTKDQKTAAFAALLVLANQKKAIPADRATQITPRRIHWSCQKAWARLSGVNVHHAANSALFQRPIATST